MGFPQHIILLLLVSSSLSLGLGVSEPLVGGGSLEESSGSSSSSSTTGRGVSHPWNRIEGKVIAPMEKKTNDWLINTQIFVRNKQCQIHPFNNFKKDTKIRRIESSI